MCLPLASSKGHTSPKHKPANLMLQIEQGCSCADLLLPPCLHMQCPSVDTPLIHAGEQLGICATCSASQSAHT
jgi:hypothetical protein